LADIRCPGAVNLRLEVKVCPACGAEVEIFSDEYKTTCTNCGSELFRDLASCIDWCPYAKKCLDERERKKAVLTLR
jgi:anaerobic ribonucleoside-triphosphate reductase